MDVKGGLRADGSVAGYDFATRYPSNGAPTLALLLTGTIAPTPDVFEMGDRTAIPPYDYDAMRVVAHDMPPIVRASWLRGVSALPNTFAHESYIDELATEAGVDPIEYRLRYLKDPRADRPRQRRRRARRLDAASGPARTGRRGRHRARAGLCLCAVCPQQISGLRRGVVGLDRRRRRQQGDRRCQRDPRGGRAGFRPDDQSGRRAPPDPWQRHPVDQPRADGRGLVRPQRGDQPRMGRLSDHQIPGYSRDRRPDAAAAGSAAARRRRIRVGPECGGDRQRHLRCDRRAFSRIAVHAGTNSRGDCAASRTRRAAALPMAAPKPRLRTDSWHNPFARRRGALAATIAALCAAAIGIAAAVLPWRSIAPIARPDASVYSAATIARGEQLAALGDCAVCHTDANGAVNAGGRAIETPFGTIYSTNITPRSRDRDRRMVLSRLRTRDARRHPSRRPASLSGVSVYAFRQGDRRRPAGALRLSDGAGAGARREPRDHACRFRSIGVR